MFGDKSRKDSLVSSFQEKNEPGLVKGTFLKMLKWESTFAVCFTEGNASALFKRLGERFLLWRRNF